MKIFIRAIMVFFFVASSSAQSALITTLTNLDIGGTLYDATFHADIGNVSFNQMFDANNNNIFGDDSSIANKQPTFLNDGPTAALARDVIMATLGAVDHTTSLLADSFIVPGEFTGSSITTYFDTDISLSGDTASSLTASDTFAPNTATNPWVTFELSGSSPVPAPGTLWLMLSGLFVMVAKARSK